MLGTRQSSQGWEHISVFWGGLRRDLGRGVKEVLFNMFSKGRIYKNYYMIRRLKADGRNYGKIESVTV